MVEAIEARGGAVLVRAVVHEILVTTMPDPDGGGPGAGGVEEAATPRACGVLVRDPAADGGAARLVRVRGRQVISAAGWRNTARLCPQFGDPAPPAAADEAPPAAADAAPPAAADVPPPAAADAAPANDETLPLAQGAGRGWTRAVSTRSHRRRVCGGTWLRRRSIDRFDRAVLNQRPSVARRRFHRRGREGTDGRGGASLLPASHARRGDRIVAS